MKNVFLFILLLLPVYVFGQRVTVDELYNHGITLYSSEQYEEAIPYFEKCVEFEENYSEIKIRSIALLSNCYVSIDNYTDAIKYGYQLLEIIKILLGEEDPNYANVLEQLQRYYSFLGNYQQAINLGTQAMEIRKKVLGENHPDYASSLNSLAIYNYYLGKYQNAISLGTQAMEIRKKVLGEQHPDYAASLSNLAVFYEDIGNYQDAIRMSTQALEIYKNIIGEEHPDYATSLSNLANNYHGLGNYQEAIRVGTKAMEIRKKLFGEEHLDYAASLSNLAEYYFHISNHQEAIRLCMKAMEIRKKLLGENHPDYAASLNNLASYYSDLGNYQEAIRLGTQAMNIRKKTLGENHPDYAASLSNLTLDYSYLGNYQESIRLGTQAMEIRKKVLGENHPDYAASLNNLALVYSDLGNYQEALRLGTQAMEIREKVLGENHPDYATSLNNIANYHSHLGNYQEAVMFDTQAMEIRKKVLGENHLDYAASLTNLASDYKHLGNYQEAISLGTQAMEIYKNIVGEEHPGYAASLHNLASDYNKLGNFSTALKLETQAMEIWKKILGTEHHDYTASLSNLATICFNAGKYEEATIYHEQTYYRTQTSILKAFAYLTNKERSDFWNKYHDLFNDITPLLAYYQPNPTLKSLTFNSQLLSKGLLLNADIEIQNLIEKQDNEQLKDLYYKLKQDRKILDELYQLPINKRTMNADSLAKVIDNEEHNLVESCQEIGDYTKNLSINWTDVQKKLKENDVAIEFANFKEKKSSDNHIYIALVLKKDMTAPELVTLDFSDTDTIDYTTSTLYNRIWKPLEKYLQGVQNVYFSPTGKFHTIGIEYLSDDNGEIFAKKYNAYRLSSTRELALEHVANLNKKASVYGGIVYNFTQDDWQNISEDAERAGITFLKGAKVESEEITDILSESSYDVTQGTDKSATEESFKKLSGSGIKILHIATHGFYEPESKEKSFADMLSIGDKNSKEDLSLSRSGLFFAGANTALDEEQRQNIPDGVDDGILTAKEISRMDFKGLDLVVLSACQTGLGKVTSEGVFGLQRGFKKAGAQTIVMSLWNVSDKPTRELMTEFYRNLVSGQSKREAFILAQDKIRQKYINPKMWAGFIMVDGIE